jgi:hypothetical protein
MKKTQELQAISEPLEALDAIEAALVTLVQHPELADEMNGNTLRPVSKVITRSAESETAPESELVEYAFTVTQDGAGCDGDTTALPEPERLLIEA